MPPCPIRAPQSSWSITASEKMNDLRTTSTTAKGAGCDDELNNALPEFLRTTTTTKDSPACTPCFFVGGRSGVHERRHGRPRGVHHCRVVSSEACCDGAAAQAAKPAWPVNAASRLRFPTGAGRPLVVCSRTGWLCPPSSDAVALAPLPFKHAALHTRPTNANAQPPLVDL